MPFFWADHVKENIHRGPFKSSHDWLQTQLQFVSRDQERMLESTEDEDDLEDAQFTKDLAGKISQILPNVFPPDTTSAEPSILFHDDLYMQNILVDEDGKLTAVVDWECVSAVPLWRACRLPKLLEGNARYKAPQLDEYTPVDLDEVKSESLQHSLDNEGTNSIYWEHLLEYEQTQLREVFLDEMKALKLDWVTKMRNSIRESDIELAVLHSDSRLGCNIVNRWVESFLQGHVESLADKLENPFKDAMQSSDSVQELQEGLAYRETATESMK